MKRTLFLSILIIFFTISLMSLVGFNNQKSTKEDSTVSEKKIKEVYDFQEMCRKQSKEIFKGKYDGRDDIKINSDKSYWIYEHSNYYNKKMNKCFQLEVIRTYTQKAEVIQITKELFDINEDIQYGFLRNIGKPNEIYSCFVLKKKCKSEEEWDSLVKPYMEE
jgi:hypothetical protein